jgi:membrane protease YdiL (CAAX protease family)
MSRQSTSTHNIFQQWGQHVRGHVFLFEGRPAPAYPPSAGLKLLLIVLLLEGIIGPRLSLFKWLGLPLPRDWLRVPVLLILVLQLVRFFAGLSLSQIGLLPWRKWSLIEKSYFIQVFVIANVVFSILFAGRLRAVLGDQAGWGNTMVVILTYFLWGFYQEVIYRSLLQTELVRRWGTWPGILVSNLLYTFGPLHLYHFSDGPLLQSLPMFAGIFAIGSFFAVVFQRSGNLTMVGIFHAIGDIYITGLASLVN